MHSSYIASYDINAIRLKSTKKLHPAKPEETRKKRAILRKDKREKCNTFLSYKPFGSGGGSCKEVRKRKRLQSGKNEKWMEYSQLVMNFEIEIRKFQGSVD
ncbi:hypothetical protein TNIN_112211 [Trichonephila inaurata madagascariensis]|uniref:Uncharacterized protein n=1 Tax=Trichonephila inaurata madagascariensis TaxID=2747483 RepID=A0A8X7CFR8_9ARAC|nr:hypothetical protein TNIN_112211 [Trichonephila inaurata madagascariensis]